MDLYSVVVGLGRHDGARLGAGHCSRAVFQAIEARTRADELLDLRDSACVSSRCRIVNGMC